MEILMSDLHISSPLFKEEETVINLYRNPGVKSIYIVGDLFDTWEGCIKRTVKKRRRLIDIINNSGKTEAIIQGNHDPSIEVMMDIFPNVFITDSYFTEFFGKSAIIVHGHEFDGTEFWGKALFTLQWPIERLGLNPKAWIRNFVYKNKLRKSGLDNNSLVFDMEKMLFDKYKKDFDIIISGHTHLTKLVRKDGIYYVNTGTLLYNPSYIIVEGNSMRIKRL